MKFPFAFLILQALQLCALAGNNVVNLSHFDMMRPDFPQMRSQGIVGVIHEASYPRYVQDDKYSGRQQAAVSAGLLWGAYHFAEASNPTRQADHFLNVVSNSWRRADAAGRPNEVLLVLDFEKNGHYPGGTMTVDGACAFIRRIHEKTGKYPGVYSGEYRINSVLNHPGVTEEQKRLLRSCWLWVANYHHTPRNVAPWRSWDMWQYTGDGVCDLPRGSYPKSIANIRNAERNIFRGGDDSLRSFWQNNGWNPGTVTTVGE
jgi:lysozyme